MSQVPAIAPFVLARATTAEDVAEMRRWQATDLFSVAERGLESVLSRPFGGSLRNRIIESLRVADGSPHFLAEYAGSPYAVYVVCVSSMASFAELTAAQYAWAEAHPAVAVAVLPCVVQRTGASAARCVVEQLYILRHRGQWSTQAESRQFMPFPHGLAHFCGSAAWLKMHHTVREVANGGTRIYPYVAGVVSSHHLPADSECRCSGKGDFPLMLVHTRGLQNGALRVAWSGIYSAENPVNELEVYEVHRGKIRLMDARGSIYTAVCAELSLFADCFKAGMHLRWAVSLFADSFEICRRREYGFKSKGEQVECFRTEIASVALVDFCGMRGYCMQARVHAKHSAPLFNIYVFEHLLHGRVPRVGDFVQVSGLLQAAADALVESAICWADSPETAAAAAEDASQAAASAAKEQMLPYGAPLAELWGAFHRAGYGAESSFEPLFRFGRPEFRLISPQGKLLLVMVDTVVSQHEDKLGYRCRFAPDKYPSHMTQTPQGDGPADVCFITLRLEPLAHAEYALKHEEHGILPGLSLPSILRLSAPDALTESAAAELFADCMSTQNFERIIPFLKEDLHYCSETAGLEFFSKTDFLRHLRSCFDIWKKKGVLNEISFTVKKAVYQDSPCISCVATQGGTPVSVTLVKIKDSFISEIRALPPTQFEV